MPLGYTTNVAAKRPTVIPEDVRINVNYREAHQTSQRGLNLPIADSIIARAKYAPWPPSTPLDEFANVPRAAFKPRHKNVRLAKGGISKAPSSFSNPYLNCQAQGKTHPARQHQRTFYQ